jgi:hypothetical protein
MTGDKANAWNAWKTAVEEVTKKINDFEVVSIVEFDLFIDVASEIDALPRLSKTKMLLI